MTKPNVFTSDQVLMLLEHQTNDEFHPYTCGNRGDGKHREFFGDIGILFPTVRGWVCPFCDYTQTTAHGMTIGEIAEGGGRRRR